MKSFSWFIALLLLPVVATSEERSIESFDTPYNSLTVEREGTLVELRAHSRRGEFIESAVDLAEPRKLVVAYTRSLFAGLFFQPKPSRVLMIGLGGAGFHRLFSATFPESKLLTVELDPKVYELCQTHLGFKPTANEPIELMDGRLFVKRNREKWDWIILDAFRGGFVPSHLKTEEFYQECAERLDERGVFMTNLHQGTELFLADIKTLRTVFPQVVLFYTANKGNVIACAVKYRSPDISDPKNWGSIPELTKPFKGFLDLQAIALEFGAAPEARVARAKVLTDDFSPAEFLDTVKDNNTAPGK